MAVVQKRDDGGLDQNIRRRYSYKLSDSRNILTELSDGLDVRQELEELKMTPEKLV